MLGLRELVRHQLGKSRLIVVTGVYSSGKSRFITSLTQQALEPIDITGYVEYSATDTDELGKLTLSDDSCLYFLEWPGSRRADLLQRELEDFLLGTILVFDSSKPETFRETLCILKCLTGVSHLPVVIAASPHKQTEAWTLEDLRVALKLQEDDALVTWDPTQKGSAAAVISKLIEKLPDAPFIQQIRVAIAGG